MMNFVWCRKNKVKSSRISFPNKNIFSFISILGDLYAEFKEADIHFPPTYKFELRADGDVYAKHRTPSYTVSEISVKINEK